MNNSTDETLDSKQMAVIDQRIAQSKLTERTYKHVLDQEPPKEIIRHHPYGKFDYLPITAVERFLDGLYEFWTPEILDQGPVVNGFWVSLRLHVKIPDSDRVICADGIGFAEFQTSKGAAPTDFTKLMPGAGVLAIPKAKSEALKNAAKSLGNLFGRNLARNDDNADYEKAVVNLSRKKIANTLLGEEVKKDE